MKEESKNKFTAKIMVSYLVLCVLALVAGYFIYSEIQVFMSNETAEENDIKLLKTGSLVTQLYEAESLSKLALQTRTQENFNAFAHKTGIIFAEIDTLKQLSNKPHQKALLDSLQLLLQQKVANSNELRNLKVKNEGNNSIDKALRELKKMEASFGKLTIENFEKNPENLSPYQRKVLEDWVAYLNLNIPSDTSTIPDAKKIDSILNASKSLLTEAKRSDAKTQRFLNQKEMQINQNDIELSQQLRIIVSAFEEEVVVNTYNNNVKKQLALRRSMRLAGLTALLGFVIVGIFTFMISRDFWKVQTYRQKLEKEKKYSESLLKSREQLISTVSHDLRTPLNTITGYSELMENTALTQKQERYLKQVKSASQYVGNLVSDLLDFSKLEAGKLNIEKVSFIPAHLIQETAENIKALHTNKKLKLYLEIDPELEKTVLGDPFRIRQILTNLIGNAFKFTEEGHIKITAKAILGRGKSLTAKIDIVDTGVGIAKEKQHLIFKEFTQADDDTDKKFGGHGLGLTISKKLAELLNGDLTLESKLGNGSAFTLRLPLEITKSVKNVAKEMHYMAPKLRMLIIDDDTALLHMLRELAESMGITVHTFTNFLSVEKDSHLDYDIVLTDIQMPQVTGFEVLKKLQSGTYKHYKEQPIIAMTGRRDLGSEAYIGVGFAQVLQKPFSKGELIATLKLMGITTVKVPEKKEIESADSEQESKLYSLDIIHSFLGKNEEAIYEVLQTFLMDTDTNMGLLEETIASKDYDQVNQVAHRMLPMFRQLKVATCVSLLEKLEVATPETIDGGILGNSLQLLKTNVAALVSELEDQLATSLDYSG